MRVPEFIRSTVRSTKHWVLCTRWQTFRLLRALPRMPLSSACRMTPSRAYRAIRAALPRQPKRGDEALVGNAGYCRFFRAADDGHFASTAPRSRVATYSRWSASDHRLRPRWLEPEAVRHDDQRPLRRADLSRQAVPSHKRAEVHAPSCQARWALSELLSARPDRALPQPKAAPAAGNAVVRHRPSEACDHQPIGPARHRGCPSHV